MSRTTKSRLRRALHALESALAALTPGFERAWAEEVGRALAEAEHALRLHLDEETQSRSNLVPIRAHQTFTPPILESELVCLLLHERDLLAVIASTQAELQTSLISMRKLCQADRQKEVLALREVTQELVRDMHKHLETEAQLVHDVEEADLGVVD